MWITSAFYRSPQSLRGSSDPLLRECPDAAQFVGASTCAAEAGLWDLRRAATTARQLENDVAESRGEICPRDDPWTVKRRYGRRPAGVGDPKSRAAANKTF